MFSFLSLAGMGGGGDEIKDEPFFDPISKTSNRNLNIPEGFFSFSERKRR